jgi:NDP-sugar pyrophosphorylase family protein
MPPTPTRTPIDPSTVIGPSTVIEPSTTIGRSSNVGPSTVIGPSAGLGAARIDLRARFRPGADAMHLTAPGKVRPTLSSELRPATGTVPADPATVADDSSIVAPVAGGSSIGLASAASLVGVTT